jgi:putative aldouronate transport system substrate-binding protein
MSRKNHPISRRDFLKIASLSTVSLTLAACAQKPSATTVTEATAPPKPTEAPPPTATPAPKLVELNYVYPGNEQKDLKIVNDAITEILKAKINATIKLSLFAWGDYTQKLQLMNTSGEKYDLCFTSFWFNDYVKNVQNGTLAPMDDLLPTAGKGLYASMPDYIWKACRVGGKIYGAPNQQIFAFPTGIDVRKDLADKYKLDPKTIKEYVECEPYLKAIKDGEGITPIYTSTGVPGQLYSRGGLDYVLGGHQNGYTIHVKADDPEAKAFSIAFDDANFGEAVRLANKWYQAGYYTKDIVPDAEANAAMKAGKHAFVFNDATKPGNALEKKALWGFEWYSQSTQTPVLNTSGVIATLTAISANSVDVERSMMYLNEINTNVELYNLLCKGIEGKHWVWTNKEKKVIGFPEGVTAENSGYNPNTDWEYGNQFNAYYVSEDQVGAWEETDKINKEAVKSVLLGFSFNQEPVKTEIAQVQAAAGEMEVPLMRGMLDPATALPDFQKKLKDAGIDKVIAEMQKQIDEWRKANT